MKSVTTTAKYCLILVLALSCSLSLLLLSATPYGENAQTPLDAVNQSHASSLSTTAPEETTRAHAEAREAYGKLELHFEANQGQTDASVNFLARGAGYTMFLKPAEAVFVLSRQEKNNSPERTAPKQLGDDAQLATGAGKTPAPVAPAPTTAVLRMKLVGANASAAVEGADELAGKVNYFKGNDPQQWHTGVRTYARVRYSEVYPGIDLVYYGNQKQLEYDFVVAPGRDARAVTLKFEGADTVEVDAQGELVLTLGDDVVRQPKPFIYQEAAGGERQTVEGGYELQPDGRVGFSLGEYDASRPLVIDPVLVYSTYLGGSGFEDGSDIKVDSAGNAYVCGQTNSTNFPTANAFQATFGGATFEGGHDGFVTKLNAAGTGFVYSTYLGGNGDDRCNKVAVDADGNAYLAGETTSSTNFPRANAFQNTFGGGLSDAFITKLNANGSALIFSTYLGGDIFDAANGIALDSSNNVYITGRTTSGNFPTANAIQAAQAGIFADAFVTKFNAAGNALVYSTYLGGSEGTEGGFDAGFSIAVDSAGGAYVTGQTRSTNFPTLSPVQATFGGGFPDGDGFVTKVNAAGTAFAYSTYLGGSENDIGFEIAVDSANSAYVSGVVRSTNFPTANAFQSALNGTSDAFMTKLNPTGSAFVYSTYFGGNGDDSANGIAVNASNEPYLAIGTSSTNLPTVSPTQAASGGGIDAFVTRFNAAGNALIYATYLGGSGTDAGLSIALDSALSIYLVGRTTSTNFPTLTPVQSTFGGGQDGFVTKISLDPPATPTPTPPAVQFAQAAYTVAEGLERNTDPASLVVTVTRTGNTAGASTVEYRTVDLPDAVRCDTVNGSAYHRCDYATTLGTLSFAAGETSKTFSVFITDDAHVEGNETFQITLAGGSGATVGTQSTTTVTVQDNDTAPSNTNPIDVSEFFFRQHYIDFLARAPEAAGFADWVAALNGCGAGNGDRGRNPACDRIMVSSGFFRSDEYLQVKGYFAYRFYEVAFGRRPTYMEFVRDLQRLTGATQQDTLARMAAFTVEFTERQAFTNAYPAGMTLAAYVDALFNTAEIGDRQSITRQDGTTLTRAQLADGSRTRAAILREIVESREVASIFYNRAFVTAQYFGYLRRDPESPGYEMWLAYLNANPSDFRTMVNGFLNSVEYRLRFGRPN